MENADLDFEKRVARIFDTCRSPEEIETAFNHLQKELEAAINERMEQTAQKLQKVCDQDVRERLKMRHAQTKEQLSQAEIWFWRLVQYVLKERGEISGTGRLNLTRPRCPTLNKAGTA